MIWSYRQRSVRMCGHQSRRVSEAAREGAIVLVNCSASDETIGKDSYREELIKGQSARLIAGYVYANAGDGESTTDVVFGGHNIIAENGTILKEAKRFANEMICQ